MRLYFVILCNTSVGHYLVTKVIMAIRYMYVKRVVCAYAIIGIPTNELTNLMPTEVQLHVVLSPAISLLLTLKLVAHPH